jgi:hypothetical protein
MRYPLVALTLAAMAAHAWAEEGYSAKSLFFSESDSVVAVSTSPKADAGSAPQMAAATASSAPANAGPTPAVVKVSQKKKRSSQLGASYFIRLKDPDGSTHDVLARRVFKSGEKFQLGVKVNRPSYVYILNEAPDGSITQIYPQPSCGRARPHRESGGTADGRCRFMPVFSRHGCGGARCRFGCIGYAARERVARLCGQRHRFRGRSARRMRGSAWTGTG